MLVLSRRKNEQIIVGDGDVIFTIVEIRGDKVRIGVDAPKEVPVHRKEVYDAIRRDAANREKPQDHGSEGQTSEPGDEVHP